jgi:predicted nucleotidyltransferase
MVERTSDAEMQLMRKNFRERQERRRRELEQRLETARKDFNRIVDHIARTYRPKRIWQWGSLIDGHHFSERSDIDIAIEGIEDPKTFFAILGDAMDMSSLPVDVVQIEAIHPAYADSIRSRGRIAYER